MTLLKRILINLFPEEMTGNQVSPASVFVSFISAKHFFSVINRKIVENFKLNLFDISLDSFEAKLWFGDQMTSKNKDLDFYYSYGVVANLNGFRFFNPTNVANALCLIVAWQIGKDLKNEHNKLFLTLLFTTYLINFVIISRVKIFPEWEEKHKYNRFIELFFELFTFIYLEWEKTLKKKEFEQFKNIVLKHVEIFFMLYRYLRKVNDALKPSDVMAEEYFDRLFHEELEKKDFKKAYEIFVSNHYFYTTDAHIHDCEKRILTAILPADILVRYMFDKKDIIYMSQTLVPHIFDESAVLSYLKSFLKSDEKLEEFMIFITDYTHMKQNRFGAIRGFVNQKLAHYDRVNPGSIEDDIEDMLSSVGNENVQVPERIKIESSYMERLMNYYLTYMWSLWIGRGDTFYLRLFRHDILDKLVDTIDLNRCSSEMMQYYASILFNYTKNAFYYSYAFDSVRSGKSKFQLPIKADLKEIHTNMYILHSFNQQAFITLLQDINIKDIKIYVKNKEILSSFKKMYSQTISNFLRGDRKQFITSLYISLANLTGKKQFIDVLDTYLTDKDLTHIKENLYSLDFWIWQDAVVYMLQHRVDLDKVYQPMVLIGITASLRDTLFGYLLYLTFVVQKHRSTIRDQEVLILNTVYFRDVLNVNDEFLPFFHAMIEDLYLKYEHILSKWIGVDDNKWFLELGANNWINYTQNKSNKAIFVNIQWEDIIWLRSYLKSITFYNKRYIIPSK
jgi:hypothetical protein